MPRGGNRVGSGRKRKAITLKVLHGTATNAERKAVRSEIKQEIKESLISDPGNQIGENNAPADLTPNQRAVWLELAPGAEAAGTLAPETLAHFRMLCSAVALMRAMEAEIEQDGLTGTKVTLQMDESGGGLQAVEKKAHTLLSRYTTVMQRVEAGLTRFGIAATGKPKVDDTPKELDPFAQFEVVQGGKQ